MQIFIKTLTGKTITIEVDSSDLVNDVKAKIEEREGVPICLQRLGAPGSPVTLDDEKSLSFYNISKEVTLQLFLRHYGKRELRSKLDTLETKKKKFEKELDALETKKKKHKVEIEKLDKEIDGVKKCIDNVDPGETLQDAKKNFSCPTCLEDMAPPKQIWQCISGHTLCSDCKNHHRIKNCPTCDKEIISRNLALENLYNSLY